MSSGLRTQPRSTDISLLMLKVIMRQGSVPKFKRFDCILIQSPGSRSNPLPVTVKAQVSCSRCLLNIKRAMSLAMA